MRGAFYTLAALALAGCIKEGILPAPTYAPEPIVVAQTENTVSLLSVESSGTSLLVSYRTLEGKVEIFHRKWERQEPADKTDCLREKAYYMSEEEGMEVVLTDDECNGTVDLVYLPFQGEYGRGVMTEAQRQQADDGFKQIKEDLNKDVNLVEETRKWHERKEEGHD